VKFRLLFLIQYSFAFFRSLNKLFQILILDTKLQPSLENPFFSILDFQRLLQLEQYKGIAIIIIVSHFHKHSSAYLKQASRISSSPPALNAYPRVPPAILFIPVILLIPTFPIPLPPTTHPAAVDASAL